MLLSSASPDRRIAQIDFTIIEAQVQRLKFLWTKPISRVCDKCGYTRSEEEQCKMYDKQTQWAMDRANYEYQRKKDIYNDHRSTSPDQMLFDFLKLDKSFLKEQKKQLEVLIKEERYMPCENCGEQVVTDEMKREQESLKLQEALQCMITNKNAKE